MASKEFMLQHLLFEESSVIEETVPMYYESKEPVHQLKKGENVHNFLIKNNCFDFFTYFNALSIEKWRKYTIARHFTLSIDIEGEFKIIIFGHFYDNGNVMRKEILGRYYFNLKKRETIRMEIPERLESTVIGFQIKTITNCHLYEGAYYAEADETLINDPHITLVTTTFKKEKYLENNYGLLVDSLFSDPELKKHFNWIIVDNGRTLDKDHYKHENIEIIPNRNVGGSGGFCRGMIAAQTQEEKPTHILLMDDDVCFFTDSFRRIYMLLLLQKDAYKEYFISGAMLEITMRNIQHEDVGLFFLNGSHGPAKSRFDLSNRKNVVRNECILPEDSHQYSGWWYCCIPSVFVREDNLPMPFFIRGDDVEYSIRNKARFITMNGICIWHEGFGAKFSGPMEFYQVHRNDLILQAINRNMKDVDVIGRIRNLFWEELFKFNYRGCDLLLDSVDDYLKGPEFLKKLDGEQCMKDKKAKDNTFYPLTMEIIQKIHYDPEHLYDGGPLTGLSLELYGHSVNGQRLPEIFAGKRIAVIPYGWGYSQKRLFHSCQVYAVDPVNKIFTVYKRDKVRYREVRARYNMIMNRYSRENADVADEYLREAAVMTGTQFWHTYLDEF